MEQLESMISFLSRSAADTKQMVDKVHVSIGIEFLTAVSSNFALAYQLTEKNTIWIEAMECFVM